MSVPIYRILSGGWRALPYNLVILALACALVSGACNKDKAKAGESDKKTLAAEEAATGSDGVDDVPAPEDDPFAGMDRSFTMNLMGHYETCRALLASDKVEGVITCAVDIGTAAVILEETAPTEARAALVNLFEATLGLSRASKGTGEPKSVIEDCRQEFGKVSEAVLAVLVAAPESAQYYHLFECPMVKGYKRWIQPNDKLSNPYMGSKMPSCGSEVPNVLGVAKP